MLPNIQSCCPKVHKQSHRFAGITDGSFHMKCCFPNLPSNPSNSAEHRLHQPSNRSFWPRSLRRQINARVFPFLFCFRLDFRGEYHSLVPLTDFLTGGSAGRGVRSNGWLATGACLPLSTPPSVCFLFAFDWPWFSFGLLSFWVVEFPRFLFQLFLSERCS